MDLKTCRVMDQSVSLKKEDLEMIFIFKINNFKNHNKNHQTRTFISSTTNYRKM